MNDKDIAFLNAAFKKYYFDHFDLIDVPEKINKREFGYQKFNTGMIRHVSLKNHNELRVHLMNESPSDVYCSNGYYMFPALSMSDKDWQGADLIFDIDAKDLNLACRPKHVCLKCSECNETFQNSGMCPKCNSKKITSKSFTCHDCIKMAKNEVVKLEKILVDDLGIDKQNIFVYFSGNEGFHIHVNNSAYTSLDSRQRLELADYIMFKNILPETLGMKKYKPHKSDFPEIGEAGWRGRAAKEIFGSKAKRSQAISEIISKGYDSFAQTLQSIAPKIGAVIDPGVTTDIHRIFRLAGTLNSKSGLTKMRCTNLETFNPYKDACFIDDSKTSVMADAPAQFTLRGRRFGPYHNEQVSLPKYAAVYLICKGFATF